MTATAKKAAAKSAEKPKDDKSEAPKRKSYTPEEKIAKLEADLAAARTKAQEKQQKQIDGLQDKVDKAQEKVDKANLELAAAKEEYDLAVSAQAMARPDYMGEADDQSSVDDESQDSAA